MNIDRIIQTIKYNKFQTLKAEDFGFANYSDGELVKLLKLSGTQSRDPASQIAIQVIPENDKNLSNVLQVIDRLDEQNYLSYLCSLPTSFRITNIQLLSDVLIHENNRLYDSNYLSFFTNLYFTPNAQHNALGLHFDDAHIFVHQIRGAKSWTLLDEFRNGEYLGIDLSKLDLINGTLNKVQVILRENELLYIPAKLPHKATALGKEASTHLTYAFRGISSRESVTRFVVSKILKEANVQENGFEVLMDHEADIVKAILECVNGMDVEKITRELKLMQITTSKHILQNGMRMHRR